LSTREPIRGKVARVLNSRELVINRGSEDGVRRGTVFEVLDPGGSDIPDPDTGEVLGSVYRPKVRVRVVVVEPRLSIASTYRVRRVNTGGTGGLIGVGARSALESLRPPNWIEVPETFKSNEAAWEEISEDESLVRTGDLVREVFRTRRAEGATTSAGGEGLEPAE
jgi:hypothetical protein